MVALTLYFDGHCAFCAAEMRRLRRWDRYGALSYIDIAEPGFDPAILNVDMAALDREIHSRTELGVVLIGIDSLLAAYTLVGKGWLVWPLRVRLLRPALAAAYRLFARHRYRVSRWLGYRNKSICAEGVCGVGNPFLRR